ncbi:hypothetical protein [Paraburkholderia sp. RL17-337-BIB-A]|uniref:hypothetical protein n=1 Tax=Paraburkholderia sp. RL17-337-BIB-A TaxID=3031636 RepID=UPI0038BAFE20
MGIQVFKGITQQRARILGQIRELEEQARAADAKVAELQRQVAAFDEVLRAQGVDIDPDEYMPVPPQETFEREVVTQGALSARLLIREKTSL